MKIFIDNCGRSAVSRMFKIWEKSGHKVSNKPRGADIQLSSVKIKKKCGIPIVLRVDGVYYDKSKNYRNMNISIGKAHHIANAIVYQSKLSKNMCEKYLTRRTTKIFKIIHNGIDPSDWNYPKEHEGINIVSCAKWRRPKRLQETVQIFLRYLKYYPNAKLHIIGPMMRGARVLKHKNIMYHGRIGYNKMRRIYSEMDMYLHLCKKDSCPSTVVEAIASGIPIVTTNACGGATEMCKLTDGCIVVSGESGSLEPDYIYQNLYNMIPNSVENRILKNMIKITKNKSRVALPEKLNIEYTAKQYLSIMEDILHGN